MSTGSDNQRRPFAWAGEILMDWNATLELVREEVGEPSFEAWFGSLRLKQIDETGAVLTVPTLFLHRRMETRYCETLRKCIGLPVTVEVRHPIVRDSVPLVRPAPVARRRIILIAEEEVRPPPPKLPACVIRTPVLVRLERATARCFNIPIHDLHGQSRRAHIVWPRQVGMFVARHYLARSYPEIGRRFGGRDHTTVLSACRKVAGVINKGSIQTRAEVENVVRAAFPERVYHNGLGHSVLVNAQDEQEPAVWAGFLPLEIEEKMAPVAGVEPAGLGFGDRTAPTGSLMEVA